MDIGWILELNMVDTGGMAGIALAALALVGVMWRGHNETLRDERRQHAEERQQLVNALEKLTEASRDLYHEIREQRR